MPVSVLHRQSRSSLTWATISDSLPQRRGLLFVLLTSSFQDAVANTKFLLDWMLYLGCYELVSSTDYSQDTDKESSGKLETTWIEVLFKPPWGTTTTLLLRAS